MCTFTTERLTLRLLNLDDAEPMESLIDDYEVARTTQNIPHPYPKGSADTFIKYRAEAAQKGDGFSFAIINKDNLNFMGVIGLHMDKQHNRGELAYWLGRPFWNNGYVSEAAKRIVQFAFEELGLNRVWAAAMIKNPASAKVMRKIGMQYEGTFREHMLKWETYEDLEYYAMLKSDFV